MSENSLNSPIIVCGMHRSGTSVISNILMKLNIFMGSKLDNNYESIFFQRQNRWLLSCIGHSWDNPKSFYDINQKNLKVFNDKIKLTLNNCFYNYFYFGMYKKLLNNNFNNINYNWGWKDPSNTFTLNIWNNIFPESKIIFIIRHPLDVALSLLNRNTILKNKDKKLKNNFLSGLHPFLAINKGGLSTSFELNNMNDALKLYNNYLKQIDIIKNNSNNFLLIKYEDFICDFESNIHKLHSFLHMDNNYNLDEISNLIDSTKVYSYKNYDIPDFDIKYLLNNPLYNE